PRRAAPLSVNLSEALPVSSDAFFYNVGAQFWLQRERFGEEGLQNLLMQWGLGADTGVALTGERSGRIPGPTWRREFCEATNCNDPGWRTGDSVNVGVGQGDVLVTPLQLANGYATFANGGTLYQPRLADEVTESSAGLPQGQYGKAVNTINPIVKRNTNLSPDVRIPIEAGLEGVVH